MKKLIISKLYLTTFFLMSFLFLLALPAKAGTLYNYPYLYKGIRSLGMGGAFTAVGKDAEALFYNPAGLYDMGLKIAILNPLVEVDQNITALATDAQNAMGKNTDTARTNALTDIISKNMGKPLHGKVSLFPHVAVKNYAIGVIGQGMVDTRSTAGCFLSAFSGCCGVSARSRRSG